MLTSLRGWPPAAAGLLLALAGTAALAADTVYFRDPLAGVRARIIEETEQNIILVVPKEALAHIERGPVQPQAGREGELLWEEGRDAITIRIPRAQLRAVPGSTTPGLRSEGPPPGRSSAGPRQKGAPAPAPAAGPELKAPRREIRGVVQEVIREQKVEEQRQQAVQLARETGVIEGRVLWGGQPLPNATVRIVRVAPQGSLLSLSSGEPDRPVTMEAVSDAQGRYRVAQVPPGEYRFLWQARPGGDWLRRLTEKAEVTVEAGKTLRHKDVELRVRPLN